MAGQKPQQARKQYALNLAFAGFAGQVGFLTLAIVVVALVAGLWLDATFGTRPLFTILVLLASVPLTIFVMFRVVLKFAAQIKSVAPTKSRLKEESIGDHDS